MRAWKMTFSSGNVGFYKKSVTSAGDVLEEVRFMTKAKYPEKLLVCITIRKMDLWTIFNPQKKVRWQEVCIWRTVEQRLVPFLEEHHADGDYFFWPDLACCHYAYETQDLFNKLEIPFIPCESNPPNSPQLRPIERFWGILEAKVYDGGWEGGQELEFIMLRQRIRKTFIEIYISLCQNLFATL